MTCKIKKGYPNWFSRLTEIDNRQNWKVQRKAADPILVKTTLRRVISFLHSKFLKLFWYKKIDKKAKVDRKEPMQKHVISLMPSEKKDKLTCNALFKICTILQTDSNNSAQYLFIFERQNEQS